MGAPTSAPHPHLPRNAAFLWSSVGGREVPSDAFAIAVDAATQDPIMGRITRPIYATASTSLVQLTDTFIAKTEELLPSGLTVSPARRPDAPVYTVAEYVDEVPPEAPILADGSLHPGADDGRSCPTFTNIQFNASTPARDDHTPANVLAYAVYLGKTGVEASSATMPFVLTYPARDTEPTSFTVFVSKERAGSPAYVAVSAIDLAGNESPRSNVIELGNFDENDAGCACHVRRPKGSMVATTLPALAMLAWLRRKARQKRS